jgi:hypothetical protein
MGGSERKVVTTREHAEWTHSPDGAAGEADGADRSVSFVIVLGVLFTREVGGGWPETAFTVPVVGIPILDLLGDWVDSAGQRSPGERPGRPGQGCRACLWPGSTVCTPCTRLLCHQPHLPKPPPVTCS